MGDKPKHGTYTISGTTLTYTPTSQGDDTFTYTFQDAIGPSDSCSGTGDSQGRLGDRA